MGESIGQFEDPSSESWTVAASILDPGVRGADGWAVALQLSLPILLARLEEETRKREDAEHNLVLFRKVSPGPMSAQSPHVYPRLRI